MSDSAFLADFIARAGRRLLPAPPEGSDVAGGLPRHGDHAISPGLEAEYPAGPGKPAAVLIPVLDRPEAPTVLFTERSGRLRAHSGQIAFPGGRIDPGDHGPLGAAIREASEEIGLPASAITPLGYGDLYLTTSGYRVSPVIALVTPDLPLVLNPDEVADAFECPLSFLMDPRNHRRETREWRGVMRSTYAMPYGDRYIWGVTAGIVRNLYERMYG